MKTFIPSPLTSGMSHPMEIPRRYLHKLACFVLRKQAFGPFRVLTHGAGSKTSILYAMVLWYFAGFTQGGHRDALQNHVCCRGPDLHGCVGFRCAHPRQLEPCGTGRLFRRGGAGEEM